MAETFPSGYGLHEFGREEESVRIGDCQLFEGGVWVRPANMRSETLTRDGRAFCRFERIEQSYIADYTG